MNEVHMHKPIKTNSSALPHPPSKKKKYGIYWNKKMHNYKANYIKAEPASNILLQASWQEAARCQSIKIQNTKINPIHKTIALYKLTRTKALFTTITKRKRIKAHIMLQSFILAKPTPLFFLSHFCPSMFQKLNPSSHTSLSLTHCSSQNHLRWALDLQCKTAPSLPINASQGKMTMTNKERDVLKGKIVEEIFGLMNVRLS